MNELMNSTEGKKLARALSALSMMGVLFLIVLTINEWKMGGYIGREGAQETISVSGEGEVFAKPDVATFSFSVTENASTVSDAQKKAEEKMSKAISFLKEGGVEEKDIKTEGYNVYPKYEYYYQPQMAVACSPDYCPPQPVKQPKIVGYEVSQSVVVKVRKIEDAGKILGGIGAINVQNVSGLSFSIDKEEDLKNEAREKAIDDAKDKAKTLAKQLGVDLDDIVGFSEGGNYPMYYAKAESVAYGRGGGDAVAPSVPTGENRILSNVTITYRIK